MFDDDKLYLAGDPALLVFGRPSTLAHWRSEGRGPAFIKLGSRVGYPSARTSPSGWPLKPSDRPTARKRGPDPDPPVPDRIRPDRACIHRGDWRCLGVGTELAGKTARSAHGQALAEPDSAQWDRHETGRRRGRRVEMADTAPVTVVADPAAAARLDPTRRLITVAGVLGTPR